MRTSILYSKQEKEQAALLVKIFRSFNMSAGTIGIGRAWRNERVRLDQLVGQASHILIVYSEMVARSSWLPYIAGFCLGSDRPLVIYTGFYRNPLPPFIAPFFNISSAEELTAFLEIEHREWAIIHNRREARRELLELGVSCRPESFVESTIEGNIHAIELFLRAGVSPNTRDKRGVPLICHAAREGNRTIVKFLVDNGADINLQAEDRGNTALMDAVAGSHIEIVQDLIANGADVNLLSKDGQSALVLAAGKNHEQMSRLLLKAGADPDIADKLGFSARKYAQLFKNPDMLALFEEYTARQEVSE